MEITNIEQKKRIFPSLSIQTFKTILIGNADGNKEEMHIKEVLLLFRKELCFQSMKYIMNSALKDHTVQNYVDLEAMQSLSQKHHIIKKT